MQEKNDSWINSKASYFILWNHIRKIICKGYYLLFHLCLATSAGNELMTIKNLPFRLRSIAKPDIASQNVMKIVVMKIQAFLERLHLGQCDVAKMWGHTPFIQNINFPPSPPPYSYNTVLRGFEPLIATVVQHDILEIYIPQSGRARF